MIDYLRQKLKFNKKLYNFLGYLFFYLQFLYLRLFGLLFSIFPINNKKILFISYYGRGYGDSDKYVCNELIKNNNNRLKIYWAYKSKKDKLTLPKEVIGIKFNSIIYLYHLTTSKIWLNNTRFLFGTIKRKKQIYIQLWHGGVAMKKIEFESNLPPKYVKTMINDNKMINIMISNGRYCTNMYKRAFRFDGKIEEYGTPRNDYLINNRDNAYKTIRKVLNLRNDERILLYAPTFRINYDNNPYDVNFDEVREYLEKQTGDKWTVLVRMHSIARDYDFTNKSTINLKALNVTDYPDMQELISACDLLITDYSSIMFEGMLIDKPVLLYAKDIDEYKNDRGLYFDFEDLPFALCQDRNNLKEMISNALEDNYVKKYEEFENKIGIFEDGKASERVSKLINDIIIGEKYE